MAVSIIVPAYNEEENISLIYKKIREVTKDEIIFVDDGSTDKTLEEIKKLSDRKVRYISFQRNYGKAAALDAGFKEASNDIIITMDADLQDDPKEIPRFVEALENYDLVSGWKKNRKDPITKTLPSKIFNFLTSRLVGLKLHDYNCGFKGYRKKVVENIELYGSLHRYIPALAYWKGFSVAEIPVKHHKRKHGKSKYGMARLLKGFFDLMSVKYLSVYNKRPLHFFGLLGFMSFGLGFIAGLYIVYLKLIGLNVGDRPILMLSVLLIVIGVQFFSLGLLGEMFARQNNKREYIVREEK